MKLRILTLVCFILFTTIASSQTDSTKNLKGSWLGKVSTPDWALRVLLRFEPKGNGLKCYLDSPDQALKDIPLDRVWRSGDSVFVDATKSLGAGLVFKGLMEPGDSVIDGIWSGSLKLRLSRTDWVFTLKTNRDPVIKGYKIVKLIPTTPIKDQQSTGVCWSFATTSFIETEAIRLGKQPVVLSPMFYVIPTLIEKAEKDVRMNGKSGFGEGDLTFSVMKAYRQYGAIPESVFTGKIDPAGRYEHAEMNQSLDKKIKHYVDSGRGKKNFSSLRPEISAIIQETMGTIPETFVYNSRKYTPKSFAAEMVGINPDDYVEVTSYTHHPFYSRFVLEIESNWNNNYYLNLPIEEFLKVVDNALMKGYSVGWDGDIYEGYDNGFAVLNDSVTNITQQMRQDAFDNHTTEDVHNMHIVGIAENDKGKRFYIVKNSSDGKNCGGYMYMSKEFLLQKTISVLVHKDAIPKEIKNKCNLTI